MPKQCRYKKEVFQKNLPGMFSSLISLFASGYIYSSLFLMRISSIFDFSFGNVVRCKIALARSSSSLRRWVTYANNSLQAIEKTNILIVTFVR